MELNCSACFPLVLPACTDSITLSLGLTPSDTIYWKLSSYKRSYSGSSIVALDGSIILTNDRFSEALFIPAEAVFVFTIESINSEPAQTNCEAIPLVICETEYPCVGISFSEQEISEEVPLRPFVSVEINSQDFADVENGGDINIPVQNEGDTPIGSPNAGVWRVGNSPIIQNGTQIDEAEAEQSFPFFTTVNGVQENGVYDLPTKTIAFTTALAIFQRNSIQLKTLAAGAIFNLKTKLDGVLNNGLWDGVDTIDFTSAPCPAPPLVTLQISGGTANLGSSQTLTATANFAATSYTFYTFDGTVQKAIVTQSSNVYVWTLDRIGIFDVYVVATDGSTIETGKAAFSTNLLLDTYASSSAAYAFLKLRTAYTGNFIRVRRSSDNAELNIGFVGWRMNTASLLAFVGAGNGFITTFYDQSGLGYNYTQTSGLDQPKIVESGVIQIDLCGAVTSQLLNSQMTNTMVNTSDSSAFVVCHIVENNNGPDISMPSMSTNYMHYTGMMQQASVATPSSGYGSPTYYVNATNFTPTQRLQFYNACVKNRMIIFSAIGGGDTTSGRMLRYQFAAQGDVRCSAIIHYNTNQAANLTGIRNILNSMYNVY